MNILPGYGINGTSGNNLLFGFGYQNAKFFDCQVSASLSLFSSTLKSWVLSFSVPAWIPSMAHSTVHLGESFMALSQKGVIT